MPQIEFVNHASYIINHGAIKLITDPWIDGTAFYDGWKLIEETKFSYHDFKTITHIWFSHEHPDHFSPSNIKAIPEEIRKNITILFHKTKDKKVLNFCKKLNFKSCIELNSDWYELSHDFKILNIPNEDGDSWLYMKLGGKTILNINDCVLEDKKQIQSIKNKIGNGPVDVLFTQFSYANWVGNKEDVEMQKKYAAEKVREIEQQILVFQPKFIVPFASFVWFCHEENFYMNQEINRIDFIHNHISENLPTKPIILFPGDVWNLDNDYDSTDSIDKWIKSYSNNIRLENTIKSKTILENRLLEAGNSFVTELKKNNTFLMRFFIKPTHIYIEDYKKSYRLSLDTFTESNVEYNKCDIALSSDSSEYCFNNLWGGASTRINGRYQVPADGRFYNWKMYFQTSELNNHGKKFDFSFVVNSLYKNIRRKIRSR